MTDENEWIDWHGGECPIPLLKAGQFEVDLRGIGIAGVLGDVWSDWDACDFDWSNTRVIGDIIKYRVVKEAAQ